MGRNGILAMGATLVKCHSSSRRVRKAQLGEALDGRFAEPVEPGTAVSG